MIIEKTLGRWIEEINEELRDRKEGEGFNSLEENIERLMRIAVELHDKLMELEERLDNEGPIA